MAFIGFLEQGVTITISLGPMIDKDDGDTEKTGLTIEDTDIYLSKNGGAKANPNDTNNCSEDANGVYRKQLDGTDTNTAGRLTVYCHFTDCLYIRQNYIVLDPKAYAGFVGGTAFGTDDKMLVSADAQDLSATLDVNAKLINGATPVTPRTAQQIRDAMKLGPTGNSPAAGSVDKHLDDIVEDTGELQTNQGAWATATGFNTTVPDAAGVVATLLGAAGASLTDLGGMSTGMKAEVQAEAEDAIVAKYLDHLIVLSGTVADDAGQTTTQFNASDVTETTDDHYRDLLIRFTSGNLNGQTNIIRQFIGWTGLSSTLHMYSALTEAPAGNDTFVILAINVGVLNIATVTNPVAGSVYERLKAVDELTEANGDGDLAAVLADTNELQTDDIPGKLTSLETHGDGAWATAVGFSTHTAANVWAVGSRTLTSFGTLVADMWNTLTSGLTTVGSIGKLLVDNINATISSRSSHSAPDLSNLDTTVSSRSDFDESSDKVTLTDATETQVDNIEVVTNKLDDTLEDDAGTYRFTQNALEESPSAGTNPNVLLSTSIASVTTQTVFTLSIGSDQDDAYDKQAIVLYDVSNNDYPSVRRITNYVGSTKTVTIDLAPDFTIVNGDGVKIFVTVIPETQAGAGAIEWEYTLTEENTGDPIADADVWVTTDEAGSDVIASGNTDQYGKVTFYLDSGTVYVWRQKSGWNFDNPDQETVS